MRTDAPSTSTMPFLSGDGAVVRTELRRVGPYMLQGLIGVGSYGTVWRGEHVALERACAVKVLHPQHLASSASTARFVREAQLASRLRHACVPTIYEVGEEPDGTRWMAMDLVEGDTLRVYVERNGPLTLGTWMPCLRLLGEVLDRAHAMEIVHRDLAPANIMVAQRAGGLFPTLLDLGLARCVGETSSIGTGFGAAMGTPGFAAPEQWEDASTVGPAADQYGLARLTVYVLTGVMPSTRSASEALARAGIRVAPAVLAVLERAEHAEAQARFGGVAAFVAAMEAAVGGVHTASRIAGARFAAPGPIDDLREPCAVHLAERCAGDESWAPVELERARRRGWLQLDRAGDWRVRPDGLPAWRLDAPEPVRVERVPELSPDAATLLGMLTLSGGELSRGLVEHASLPASRVEGALRELEQRRRARRLAGTDRIVAAPNARMPAPMAEGRMAALRAEIALRASDAADLATLRQGWRASLGCGDAGLGTLGVRRLAEHLLTTDGLAEASLAVWTTIDRMGARVAALVPLAADLVLSEPKPTQVAMLRGWLAGLNTEAAGGATALLDARERFGAGDVAPTGIYAPEVPELGDDRLMSHLFVARVNAAVRRGPADARAELARMERWMAGRWDQTDLHVMFLQLSAFVHYRARNFELAAAQAFEAAGRATRVDARVEAALAGAFAYLELGRYPQAAELAARAEADARRMLSPLRTARALRALRDVRFRAGEQVAPDATLVDATAGFAPLFAARHAFAEATIAWRAGDRAEARRWATSASKAYGTGGQAVMALASRALALVNQTRPDHAAVAETRASCRRLAEGALVAADPAEKSLLAQTLGLLSELHADPSDGALLDQLLVGDVADRPHLVRELLSIEAVCARVAAASNRGVQS